MAEGKTQNLTWERPATVHWPMVWHRYTVKSKQDGRKYSIKIQDIPVNRFDDVLDFMAIEFDKNEPISSCATVAHIFEDETVRVALRETRRRILEQKSSLFAVLDDDNLKPDIMGVALHFIASPNEPYVQVPSSKYNKVLDICEKVKAGFNREEVLESQKYFRDYGLSVAAKYYGLGISYHIFQATSQMAVTLGINGASMVFSSRYAQSSADRAGFELINELEYEDYKDEDGNVILPIKNTKSIKYMHIKYRIGCYSKANQQ